MSGPYKLTGRETSYMPQLTIVILQYRPDAAALRRTLASLAMQDTRDFAVVLGDDGSQQDYFAESRAYLAAHGITDVQTAKLIPNGGTVKNAQNALCPAATRWVPYLIRSIAASISANASALQVNVSPSAMWRPPPARCAPSCCWAVLPRCPPLWPAFRRSARRWWFCPPVCGISA